MSAASNTLRNILQRTEVRRRWASLRKSFEGVSWFFVGTVFIFALGVIFFILGVIFLAPSHSDDQTVGIIFLVIGIVGVLLGVVTFLIRCFCPRPSSRAARSTRSQLHHRHREQRVPGTNNRGGGGGGRHNDERRNSQQQRVWTIMPPLSASTPIDSSLNNRTIERTLSQAPPSYAEAVNGGRSSISIADENPPPYH
uniref:Uncharacterized protein n=1 Tax=Panagrolaimus sp. ES5 TaxID=591445 RepID=A0AC34GWS6_9BILA